jgi:hypothetical protein
MTCGPHLSVREGTVTYKHSPLVNHRHQHQSPPQRANVAKPLCKTTLGGSLNGFAKVRRLNTWFYMLGGKVVE